MSIARKIWADAKKKVSDPDGWSARLGKSDIGPMLDKFESLAADIEKDMESARKSADKVKQLVTQSHELMRGYSGKIFNARYSVLTDDEKQTLSVGLNGAWSELEEVHTRMDKKLSIIADRLKSISNELA